MLGSPRSPQIAAKKSQRSFFTAAALRQAQEPRSDRSVFAALAFSLYFLVSRNGFACGTAFASQNQPPPSPCSSPCSFFEIHSHIRKLPNSPIISPAVSLLILTS